MKIKLFDRFQHYYLDKIWENAAAGKDVAATLDRYLLMVEGSMDVEEFISQLHLKLRDMPAIDPDNGQWRTWGFVVPFHGQPEDQYISNPLIVDGTNEQSLAVEIPETGAILLCVEKREKVLPSSAINDALFDRAKAMAEREDRELNRKDYAILKEEVTASLLKTAPVRRSRIYVMFNKRDLIVFTSSQKAAEETTAVMRKCFSSLPTVPAYTNQVKLQDFFKEIVKHGEVDADFQPGSTIKLRSDEGEVITVKDGEIDDERYTDLLKRGFVITEMEFDCLSSLPGMQHIWVKMNHKGDIKSFSTSAEPDEDEFDTEYERGSAGYHSKMAELWVLHKAIQQFNVSMAETGVMVKREEIADYEDGDTVAIEKDAKQKAKEKPAQAPEEPEDTEEEDEDDDWDI
jgi:DNA recombination-dependent growth factor C